MSYSQGGMKVNGFRFGDFAYISDIRDYDDSIFDSLKGVKNLVLSALRSEPSPLHLTLDEAVDFARKVGAGTTRLTHVTHSIEHETVNRKLPADVQLGYDGLEMEFKC
jgi:phosphoribosyl 1,2-cyclic phosphate phosphodiesterase